MAKSLNEAPITTAKSRARLANGEFPRRLDADSAIWYRKGQRGGVWFARWRNYGAGAAYKQKAIGSANDENDKPAEGLFTYAQAEQAAKRIVADARAEAAASAAGPVLTVGAAVASYIESRDARDSRRAGRPVRSDAGRRLARYVLGQGARGKEGVIAAAPLAAVPLHVLKERDLLDWRAGLPEAAKAATRQRLVNDLKAALNAGYTAHRDRLAPDVASVIRHGLQSVDRGDDAEPIARESQILADADIGRLLQAARDVDESQGWEGDLFRMVVVLAATGARFSQAARLRVSDVQLAAGRIMVPASRKGKGKSGSIPVPVGQDVLDALAPIVTGRPADAVLLERWRHEQAPGGIEWRKTERGPWRISTELTRPWQAIRERAGLPAVIPYGLRHSSIVRGIRAGLPIRLVAASHDTSTAMLERHYARWITSGLEEMTRAAIVPLLPTQYDPKP